jgi:Ca-activated chloride channel homolog
VDVVLVPVTVSDSENRPVTTLKKQDFALFEEDKRQEIRYFSVEESHLSVAILVDVSKSMSDKVNTERAAIVEFFNNAHPDDEYFAIAFSDHPRVVATATQSINELETKLTAIEPGGPTAMLDAVYLAVSKLRSARYKRKAIVIFSDGGDNASRYTLREIKSLVQESDVQIYAIGLFDTFFFDNSMKLPEAAATSSRELRNQYVLGYRPEVASASKWRKIKVRVRRPDSDEHLHAYYRKGYLGAGKTASPNRDPM